MNRLSLSISRSQRTVDTNQSADEYPDQGKGAYIVDGGTPISDLPNPKKHQSPHPHRKSIDVSYFRNHHYRHHNIPNEMNMILDRIENDLQPEFRDKILSKTQRAHRLYILVVELHGYLKKYQSNFVLPYVSQNISELNDTLGLIIKIFAKYKRAKRASSVNNGKKHKLKQLRVDVDQNLMKIQDYTKNIIHGIHRFNQLITMFHGNTKFLSFLIALFPSSELNYDSMKWDIFLKKIRNNESCKRLKKFPLSKMKRLIKNKYNIQKQISVITAQRFVEFVKEYEFSISSWSKAIYSYIDSQISPNSEVPNSEVVSGSTPLPMLCPAETSFVNVSSEDESNMEFGDSDSFSMIEARASSSSQASMLDIQPQTSSKPGPICISPSFETHPYSSSHSNLLPLRHSKSPQTNRSSKSSCHLQPILSSKSHLPSTCTNVLDLSSYSDSVDIRSEISYISASSLETDDNEFGTDFASHPGYSLNGTPPISRSPSTKEPFDNISSITVKTDLMRNDVEIIHHGLFKIYSPNTCHYMDCAGILTQDRLYLASAIEYQVYQEFVERSKINDEEEIKTKLKSDNEKIDVSVTQKLIANMNLLEESRSIRLYPYFEEKSKKEIMLDMVLNNSSVNRMRKLSSYFHLDQDMPSKDIGYIRIKGFNDSHVLPQELRNRFLEYLLDGIEWINEQIIRNSMVITLKEYHYDNIIEHLVDKKRRYFVENQLPHESRIDIKDWTGHRVLYSFAEPKIIELKQFKSAELMILEEKMDSYEFSLRENDNEIFVRLKTNNSRHEWLTHLDYVLYKIKTAKKDDEHDVHHDEDEEKEQGGWHYIDEEMQSDDEMEVESAENKKAKHHKKATETFINDFADDLFGDENDEKKDEEYVPNFNFGMYLNYWPHQNQSIRQFDNTVRPQYDTLKEELLKNTISPIKEDAYYALYDDCFKLFKLRGYSLKAQNVGPNNAKCNVPKGSRITINHLISLKLYTDKTTTQNLFKKHCRRYNEQESTQDFIKRNSEIAHWCRYLIEATTFFGMEVQEKFLYTGLKDKLIFSSLTTHFYCPLSTTTGGNTTAKTYCGDEGIILKLRAAHSKSRYFNVTWLSCYHWEDERLICGAPLKIHNIFINNQSMRPYIAALEVLEQILSGYEFDTSDKKEKLLYQMLAKQMELENDDDIPQYIMQLLNKQITKMQTTMRNKEQLKKIWINETCIRTLKNPKLKCLFHRCAKGDSHHDCGRNGDHPYGQFWSHFGVNLDDLNHVFSYSWRIDEDYDQFKNMRPRKFIQSPPFDYSLNLDDKPVEKIGFYLTCYPKHTNESENCALFLNLSVLPDHIQSIKVQLDIQCDYGGKLKYHHPVLPQLLNQNKRYCGCQTLSSKKIQMSQYLEWNIGIRVIEVKYYNVNNTEPNAFHLSQSYLNDDDGDNDHFEDLSKQQLIEMLKTWKFRYKRIDRENQALKEKNKELQEMMKQIQIQ